MRSHTLQLGAVRIAPTRSPATQHPHARAHSHHCPLSHNSNTDDTDTTQQQTSEGKQTTADKSRGCSQQQLKRPPESQLPARTTRHDTPSQSHQHMCIPWLASLRICHTHTARHTPATAAPVSELADGPRGRKARSPCPEATCATQHAKC